MTIQLAQDQQQMIDLHVVLDMDMLADGDLGMLYDLCCECH